MRGDSPRGGEMSQSDRGDRALFALDAKRPEGWFLTTNQKNIRSKAQQYENRIIVQMRKQVGFQIPLKPLHSCSA